MAGKKLCRLKKSRIKYFRHFIFAQFLWYTRTYYVKVVAEFLYMLVPRDALLQFSWSNYLPEMTSVDLDKALVLNTKPTYQKKQRKICIDLFGNIFGTRSLTQLFVVCQAISRGVSSELLCM